MSNSKTSMRSSVTLDTVHKSLEVIGVALLVFIGVITALRIAVRTSTALPSLIWTGEIARYALVILTVVGIPYAMRTDDHISIRPILESLGKRNQAIMILTTNLLVVGFSFLLAYASYQMAYRTLGNPLPTVRWLNYGYVNILITVMFTLTAIYTLEQTVSEWRTLRSFETTESESMEVRDNT